MSKKKRIVGKVGYCDNAILRIKNKDGKYEGGHYVYIREYKDGKCNVNTITSLEKDDGSFNFKKIRNVKQGYLYPIPKNDANFARWSAINLEGNLKNVPIDKIEDIGKKHFKRRHKMFVGKFTKKK